MIALGENARCQREGRNTGPAISTTTGWPVGFWWSELSHSYYVFDEAGYEVQIFSPNGGKCEADAMSDPRDASGYSATDLISMGFLSTPGLAALVADTKPVSRLDVELFDAIVVAGGQAPMFTFEWAHELQAVFVRFFESGKIACALCHGVALLRFAKLSNGELGKRSSLHSASGRARDGTAPLALQRAPARAH